MVAQSIGWKAHRALARSGGVARVIARTTRSAWLVADGDVLWLGAAEILHPRAIGAAADVGAPTVRIDITGAQPWRPTTAAADEETVGTAIAGARHRRRTLDAVGAPDGLARLLYDGWRGIRSDVLTLAAGPVAALAAASDTDRPADAVPPAVALLGLGEGLTPSGDDFVGALFFARHWLGTAGVADARGWRAAAEVLRSAARDRTHPISAALLGDLLDGETYAPVHELVAALAGGADDRAAARRLTGLGHSSGWDMLAGLLVGLAPR